MRTPIVAANWKMHGRLAMLGDYVAGFERMPEAPGVTTVICPPYPYLAAFAGRLPDLGEVGLGAQDCSDESKDGAYTGEVSAAMLADMGCGWVVVGHSERRRRFAETDARVAAKFGAAADADLTPILCVGETQDERSGGRAQSVVLAQLEAVLERVGVERLGRAAVAYEPIWAIGSGEPATPEAAQEMHHLLREAVGKRSREAGESVRIIYGGSVKPGNAADFFAEPDVDGALVGGASLDPSGFRSIAMAAAAARND